MSKRLGEIIGCKDKNLFMAFVQPSKMRVVFFAHYWQKSCKIYHKRPDARPQPLIGNHYTPTVIMCSLWTAPRAYQEIWRVKGGESSSALSGAALLLGLPISSLY